MDIIFCKKGAVDIIELMSDRGVDLNERDDDDNSCAHLAAQSVQGERLLEKLGKAGFDFNNKNRRCWTPAHNAAYKGLLNNLKIIRKYGGDLSIETSDGNTCLIQAAMNNQSGIVLYLLKECRVNVNHQNVAKETALHWACYHGHVECVRILCDYNANINITDANGDTPLMHAAEHDEFVVCQELIKRS